MHRGGHPRLVVHVRNELPLARFMALRTSVPIATTPSATREGGKILLPKALGACPLACAPRTTGVCQPSESTNPSAYLGM